MVQKRFLIIAAILFLFGGDGYSDSSRQRRVVDRFAVGGASCGGGGAGALRTGGISQSNYGSAGGISGGASSTFIFEPAVVPGTGCTSCVVTQFVGFDTGGLEEATLTSGTPTVQSTVVRTGNGALQLAGNATAPSYMIDLFASVADPLGTDRYVVGFALQLDDVTPSAVIRIFSARSVDDVGGDDISLQVETNGNLTLRNSSGSTQDTVTTPFTVDTWHYIELSWHRADPGIAVVTIDGTSHGANSSDFDNSFITFGGAELDGGTGTATAYFDDFYLIGNAGGAADRLADIFAKAEESTVEVHTYQNTKNSATPDDGGTVLNTGTWDLAGQTPLVNSAGNVAIYTGVGAGAVDMDAANGSPEGPVNDPRIDGEDNIYAVKGLWNMQRGGGGGSAHWGLLGNDVDDTTRSRDFDPPASYGNFFMVSGADTIVPLATEHLRIGFEGDGAQDFDTGDMWAMILHRSDFPAQPCR